MSKGISMTTPSVGIFWGCLSKDGSMALLADKSSVDQAEDYGDCRTHATGHAEFWEALTRLGAAGLEKRGLPTAPAWHKYEAVPRGRVVFWPKEQRFIIYADRRLQGPAFIAQIVAEFGIPAGQYEVKSDSHYRAVRDLI